MESEKKFSFDSGAHVCHLFDGIDEQKAVVVPFLLEGLRQGEACLHITDRQPLDDWYVGFPAGGIDVQRAIEGNALSLITGAEFRRLTGFASTRRARDILNFIDERLQEFPGVRIAFDVAWERDPPFPADKVCHWEATADLALEDLDVVTICQYDISADSPALIHSALRTHRQIILQQQLYRNPFYEARLILNNEPHLNQSDGDARRIEEMLHQIRSGAAP